MSRTVLIAAAAFVAILAGLLLWAAFAEIAPPTPERIETVLDEAELARP